MPNHESKLKRKNVIQKSWHLLGPSLILSPYLKLKSDISEKKGKKKMKGDKFFI